MEFLAGLTVITLPIPLGKSLRQEGERYGELLRQAGVPVTVRCIQGIGHGFIEHYFARGVYDRMPEEPQSILPQDIDEKIAAAMEVIEETLNKYLLETAPEV